MDYLWGGMLLTGIVYGALCGKMQEVTDALLGSAKEAVSLCVVMTGVMALWMGMMEIAREGGLMDVMERKIRPLVRFLFPDVPEGHPALEWISANFLANFLGLGWAATPAGLKAMEALEELEEERRNREDRIRGENRETDRYGNRSKENRMKQKNSRREKHGRAMPRGTASNEMCTFLIINISSLQLIPVNILAYRSQYGSVNPAAVVGPVIAATGVSTAAAVVFCKIFAIRSVQKRQYRIR